jgi:hypothetical protein
MNDSVDPAPYPVEHDHSGLWPFAQCYPEWRPDTNGHTYQLFASRGACLGSTLRAVSVETHPKTPEIVSRRPCLRDRRTRRFAILPRPVQFLVVPHRRIESAIFLTDGDAAIARRLFGIAANLARDRGIAESGFRLASNTGRDATNVQ